MSLENTNVVDGMGIDKGQDILCLLLVDTLPWEHDSTRAEYNHLMLLQDKLNAYISFWETRQYEEHYPGKVFDMAVIELHFQYDVTENCRKFLRVVQNQVGQYGIQIETHIG